VDYSPPSFPRFPFTHNNNYPNGNGSYPTIYDNIRQYYDSRWHLPSSFFFGFTDCYHPEPRDIRMNCPHMPSSNQYNNGPQMPTSNQNNNGPQHENHTIYGPSYVHYPFPLPRMQRMNQFNNTFSFLLEDDDSDDGSFLGPMESYQKSGVDEKVINSFKNISISSKQVEDKEECSICMESYKLNELVYELPCVHIYHKECIKKWLKSNNTCPICRYELPTNDKEPDRSDPMTDLTDNDDIYWHDDDEQQNDVIDVDNYNSSYNTSFSYYSDDSESSCHCGSPDDNQEVIVIEDSSEEKL